MNPWKPKYNFKKIYEEAIMQIKSHLWPINWPNGKLTTKGIDNNLTVFLSSERVIIGTNRVKTIKETAKNQRQSRWSRTSH